MFIGGKKNVDNIKGGRRLKKQYSQYIAIIGQIVDNTTEISKVM